MFDTTEDRGLIDKRDPTRQAVTGDTLNSNAALGSAKGRPRTILAIRARCQESRCLALLEEAGWRHRRAEDLSLEFSIKSERNGTLEAMPARDRVARTSHRAFRTQRSRVRAIIEGQPYRLPPALL